MLYVCFLFGVRMSSLKPETELECISNVNSMRKKGKDYRTSNWINASPGHVFIGKGFGQVETSEWWFGFSKNYGNNNSKVRTCYRNWVLLNMKDRLGELVGKKLGCTCKDACLPKEISNCHGYVLIEMLKYYHPEDS